ncbi:hypothetical protein Pa4123_88700 [Phytohabitans aurantiacus]|uniref:HTH cro/C1-type domain-containing protein n=1 Tax=Phytohabitans aurantiacus TaxID=3016789 RepID=A0ABQ5RBM8_9ACTN|nr:hypothetical protein Pa4123_88700 [Phytohabitans aurantiacus]
MTGSAGDAATSGRIEHPIADIGGHESLVRYAAAAQLARLNEADISQATVAKVLTINAANLSHCLAGRQKFTIQTLHEIDKAGVALAPALDHTTGLAQFGVRMRQLLDRESLTASVPPNYFVGTTARSEDELHVMTQAAGILDRFLTVEKAGRPIAALRDKHAGQIKDVVERLILIAGAPPTPRNVEAQILLGSLAKYAFEITFGRLEDSLRHTALGFRVWRALTKILLLSQAEQDGHGAYLSQVLKPRVSRLLSEAAEIRNDSIYPGRSLDLELAIAVPLRWLGSPTSVTDLLYVRATNPQATLRERATAAHGLWQRAMAAGHAEHENVQARMATLITHFREAEEQRPDIASGLRWVATTLDHVVHNRVNLCNDWQQMRVDEPWFEAITKAVEMLTLENIPLQVREGTIKLFEHMLLQNAGVERRTAIDAVSAGGYVEPVARALSQVLRDSRTESWMRIRASFALGFMQHRSRTTARSLISACRDACDAVCRADSLTESEINELHTALFAIGDCYGAVGAEQDAANVRDQLSEHLEHLVDDDRLGDERMFPIARALVYLLTFTAQPRDRGAPKDLSQMLLEKLQHHNDRVTADFSKWALRFRFGENGEVRPILHAAR